MSRLLLVAAVIALACSRDNGAFILVDGEQATVGTTGAATTSADTGATTDPAGSATTTSTTGDASTGDTSGDATTEEPLRLCEPTKSEVGLELVAKLDGVELQPPPGCTSRVYSGVGKFSASALELTASNDCAVEEGPTLRVETSFISDFIWPLFDNCFVVELAWFDDCKTLRSAVIWQTLQFDEFLIAVGVTGDLPPAGAEFLGPTVEPTADGACDCEGSVTECCAGDTLAPGTYQLRFADAASTVLQEGEPPTAGVDFDGIVFYLADMRSHAHATCDDGAPVHLDWYAVRNL